MANAKVSKKVVTGLVRFKMVNVFTKSTIGQGTDESYNIRLLIPKTDVDSINKLNAGINEAAQLGVVGIPAWRGMIPNNFHNPLQDASADVELASKYPENAGMLTLVAKTQYQPGIVDANYQDIIDPDEFYSGCWGRASVVFAPYNNMSNNGVTVFLNNCMKLKDDAKLSAGNSAKDDFNDDFKYDCSDII